MIVGFKAELKKVNLKKKGVKEIVLEVHDNTLDNKLDNISCMIGQTINVEVENEIVTYTIEVDKISNQPVKSYKVNNDGVVYEEQYREEQLNADDELGIEKKVEIVKEEQSIEKEYVKRFIVEGFAPDIDDLPEGFAHVAVRLCQGESILTICNELQVSTGKLPELMDKYMEKIAPMAKAWWEWKNNSKWDGKK